MRPSNKLMFATLFSGSALLISACGSSSGPSASDLISKSQTAIAGAASVHYVQVITVGQQSQSVTGSVSATEADVVSLVNKVPLMEVKLVGTTLYLVSQSASILEKNLNLSASKAKAYTGKWISIQPSDSPYSGIIATLSIGAEVTALYPSGTKVTSKSGVHIHGTNAVAITGRSSTASSSTEQTIFINPGTDLPVAATAIARNKSARETLSVILNHWNQVFTVPAPTSSIALSSI